MINDAIFNDLYLDLKTKITQNNEYKEHLNDGFLGYNIPCDKDSGKIIMKVLPLYEFATNDLSQKIKYLTSQPRNYSDFLHYDNLKNNNHDFYKFVNIKINSDKIKFLSNNNEVKLNNDPKLTIGYSHKKEEGKDIIIIKSISKKLREIIDNKIVYSNRDIIINLLDIVFFKPETTNLIAFPIPFGTSPTSFIITSNKKRNHDKIDIETKDFLLLVNDFIFSNIDSYFNELIRILYSNLVNIRTAKSKTQFFKWFADAVSSFLIPLDYYIFRNDEPIYRSVKHIDLATNVVPDYTIKDCINVIKDKDDEFYDLILNDDDISKDLLLNFTIKSFIIYDEKNNVLNWIHKTEKFKNEIEIEITKKLNDLFKFCYNNWKEYISFREETLRSSLITVASRNLSHNIGSHVLNSLSSNSEIRKLFSEDNFIPEPIYELSKINSAKKTLINPDADLKMTELVRVFNKYLKERMDFIADYATTENAQLYTSKKLFSEVFKNFEKNQLLLKFISGKGDNFKFKFHFYYNHLGINNENFEDPYVAIPNGVLGDHAFYVILENIIRNTAKHSNLKKDDICIFNIHVYPNRINNHFRIEIYDSINHDDGLTQLIIDRNLNIAKDILNNEDKVRDKGWGTIEMKMACMYLLNNNIKNIDNYEFSPLSLNEEDIKKDKVLYSKFIENIELWESNKKLLKDKDRLITRSKGNLHRFPIIEAIDGMSNKQNQGFGYAFYLKKPKELLIFDTNKKLKTSIPKKEITSKLGVNIINDIDRNEIFRHKYLLVIDNFDFNYKNYKNLPQHIFYLHYNDVESNLRGLNSKENLEKLINKIINIKYKNIKSSLNIPKFIYTSIDYFEEGHIDIFLSKYPNFYSSSLIDHHVENFNDEVDYYEGFGSSSLLGLYIQNIEKNIENERFNRNKHMHFFIEGVNNKVLIVDERIQKEAINQKTELSINGYKIEKNLIDILEKKGINIPNEDINLNSSNLLDIKNDLYSYLKKEKAQYLVMHYGIIESLKDNNEAKDIVHEIKNIIDKNCILVITSGRGHTPDIKAINEYFLPYSTLATYILDAYNSSKSHLVELLKSLRKK
ncbi:hypothetical protein R3X25_02270 [Lutibacter sp. TH_r2]|uniref:hypothetical protein n=1 Tax=Lutibacter sp. TH_r2 TaxID=3082083 RepID=UPI0029556F5B|nr:hypothetical protein [Lutibacter sp. TH_r2]MDV7186094.1 hypothetical protein [Lutibacter sp. TH_r2]